MKDALISWVLPTTRQQGGPLDPADIRSVDVKLSADGGANFSDVADVPVLQAQEVPLAGLDINSYIVRLQCFDLLNQGGIVVDTPFDVIDDSPPGAVTSVLVTLS